jgi:hypothetical protein
VTGMGRLHIKCELPKLSSSYIHVLPLLFSPCSSSLGALIRSLSTPTVPSLLLPYVACRHLSLCMFPPTPPRFCLYISLLPCPRRLGLPSSSYLHSRLAAIILHCLKTLTSSNKTCRGGAAMGTVATLRKVHHWNTQA